MEKKKNSIEWLVEQLEGQGFLYDLDIEQAKAMHRKEIEHAYRCGAAEIGMIAVNKPKQYYNETFGGNNE